MPNIVENTRSRKCPKRGRKRLFKPAVYKLRFTSERTFAWIDKFRALLIRFDLKASHFMGASLRRLCPHQPSTPFESESLNRFIIIVCCVAKIKVMS